jgi:carbon-monoxide dehydrogenase medium subunit
MKLGLAAPEAVIDLGALPNCSGIRVADGAVRIGAMTPHAEVAASAEVARAIPALADLASQIGDRQVRNRGTLGGSLANNDPAACYPAAVLGLGGTVHTNRRSIAADDFFRACTNRAAAGEVITAVSFPVPEKAAGRSSSSRPRASRSSASSSARAARRARGRHRCRAGVFRASALEVSAGLQLVGRGAGRCHGQRPMA